MGVHGRPAVRQNFRNEEQVEQEKPFNLRVKVVDNAYKVPCRWIKPVKRPFRVLE